MDPVERFAGWSSFSARFKGELIRPSHARYDEQRAIWNGDFDKRPLVIARCTSVADVQAAVNFARDQGLLIAIRAGGHSYSGHSTCDDGIVVDLSGLRQVVADRATRTVRIGGGALLGDVDRATASHSMVVPAGVVSHTGMGGLALGGGFGYTARMFGLTCDSFLQLTVVTAEGNVVKASANENPDLFWGLRGGGGNFGVVTEFECRMHPMTQVHAGWLYFPMEQAEDVIRANRHLAAQGPRELTFTCFLGIPAERALVPVAAKSGQRLLGVRLFFAGDAEQADKATRSLRRGSHKPLADSFEPTSFISVQQVFDAFAQRGIGWYMKAGQARELSDATIRASIDASFRHSSEMVLQALFTLGGAISDIGEMDSAYSGRDAHWHVGLETGFVTSEQRAHIVEWARGTYSSLQHVLDRKTSYVNMLSDEDLGRLEGSYGAEKFRRLREVKGRWDPSNLFRCNSNIPPLNPL